MLVILFPGRMITDEGYVYSDRNNKVSAVIHMRVDQGKSKCRFQNFVIVHLKTDAGY